MNKKISIFFKWIVYPYLLFSLLIPSSPLFNPSPLFASPNNPTLNFPVAFSEPLLVQSSVNGVSNLIAADLNQDFAADLIATTEESNEIIVYKNDGTGRFLSWHTTPETSHISALHAADLDQDGDQDILVALEEKNQIGWYKNLGDGTGYLSQIRPISNSAEGATSVYSADLDGDGDPDIISASQSDNRIAWYENLDDSDLFGGQRTLTEDARGAIAVYAADLDQDGDMDIISASAVDDRISWYENRGEQEKTGFGPRQPIASEIGRVQAIAVADLDGDGDPDILSASQENNTIMWYENRLRDATENFQPRTPISTNAKGVNSIFAADMDRDRDLDILVAALDDHQVTWYMNLDGAGTFGQKRVIADDIKGAAGVYAADLDNDGDQDVVSAALLTQSQRVVMAAAGNKAGVTDISAINWHRNEIPASCSGYQRIDTSFGESQFDIGVTEWGDFDNDNDLDLLITGVDEANQPLTQIYHNDGGTFKALFQGLKGVKSSDISWGDYDNDDDLDILVIGLDNSSTPTSRIYRNDSLGSDSPSFVEVNAGLTGVNLGDALWGDYDGDNHLDILLMGLDSDNQPVTQLYRNLDNREALSQTAKFQAIESGLPALYNGSADWGDYDEDGDLDLLIAGIQQSAIPLARIYRHDLAETSDLTDTVTGTVTGTMTSTFVDSGTPLTGLKEASVAWGDYDNDNYLDVLLAGISQDNRPVAKVYHNNRRATGYTFTSIGAGLAHGIQSAAVWLDQDQDGDLDILLISDGDDEQPVTRIYENQGDGLFTTLEFEDLGLPIGAAIWADYDGDGDDDLLITSIEGNQIGATGLTIYQNEGCIDVNLVNDDHRPINLRAGQDIRYTLSYSNEGNRVAKSVVLTEVVPLHTTFHPTLTAQFMTERSITEQVGLEQIDIGWNYTSITAGSVFTMSIGDLDEGESGSVEFWVTLDEPLPFDTYIITNHATLNFDDVHNIEVDHTNNHSTAHTPLGRSSVAGIIWVDDGDGVQEPNEEMPLVDVNIGFHTSLTGTAVYSATTDRNGIFVAEGLLYGEYIVSCPHEHCPFKKATTKVDEVSAAAVTDFSEAPYRAEGWTLNGGYQAAQTIFLVHFKPDVTMDVVEEVVALMDAEMLAWLSQIRVAEIRADNMAKVLNLKHEAIEQIETDQYIGPEKGLIEVSSVLGTNEGYIPDDPDTKDSTKSYGPQNLQVFEAWYFTQGITDVVIAILDTGLDFTHIDFNHNNLITGTDLVNEDEDPSDDNGHGTHVTGIIAADIDNGFGISGICPGCGFMPVKVLDARNSGRWLIVTKGILEAIKGGAKVINMSLAGPSPPDYFHDAILDAVNHQVILIAAAGNNHSNVPLYPAAYKDVIAVNATNRQDDLWALSNYGHYLDVSAPGQGIYSTYYDENKPNAYTYKNGTSMAAPHVAGIAGLLLSQDQTRHPFAVADLIRNNSDDLGPEGWDEKFGYGRVNALKALGAEFDLPIRMQYLPLIYGGP